MYARREDGGRGHHRGRHEEVPRVRGRRRRRRRCHGHRREPRPGGGGEDPGRRVEPPLAPGRPPPAQQGPKGAGAVLRPAFRGFRTPRGRPRRRRTPRRGVPPGRRRGRAAEVRGGAGGGPRPAAAAPRLPAAHVPGPHGDGSPGRGSGAGPAALPGAPAAARRPERRGRRTAPRRTVHGHERRLRGRGRGRGDPRPNRDGPARSAGKPALRAAGTPGTISSSWKEPPHCSS